MFIRIVLQQNTLLERLSTEKGELLEKHHDQVEHLQEKFEEQMSLVRSTCYNLFYLILALLFVNNTVALTS